MVSFKPEVQTSFHHKRPIFPSCSRVRWDWLTHICPDLKEHTTLSTLQSTVVSSLSQHRPTTQPWTGANYERGFCKIPGFAGPVG